MSKIWTIARREYKQYFTSPAAYAVAAMILLIIGLIFVSEVSSGIDSFGQYVPDVINIIFPISFLFLFAIPAITMHVFSEETNSGTIELLLTAPIRDWEVVIGKWLGAFLFMLTIIGTTWVYPIALNYMIDPGIDQGVLLSGYLGLAFVAGVFVAIGVTISTFFSSQVASFITTMGVFIVMWWLIPIPARLGGTAWAELMNYLDFNSHFAATLAIGTIALSDIVYFVSVITFALLVGTVSLETRRWR
ncbi:MAG: ABC transporter permease subunit [Chloroflexi bacterium]|nr:ABC transporter permease subunit [Chloroflexota bacterium]